MSLNSNKFLKITDSMLHHRFVWSVPETGVSAHRTHHLNRDIDQSEHFDIFVVISDFSRYNGVFGDISRPVLSAGLPYSYSFFLMHTPYCSARFDLERSKWVQSPCPVPYHRIEAGQALLHVILAAITLILSVIVILEGRREKDRPKLPPPPMQYAQIKRNQLPLPNPTVSERGSSYAGTSYDDVTSVPLPEPRQPPLGYERHKRNKRAKIRPNSMPQPNFDQYSCMNHSDNDDFGSRAQARSSSSTASGRFRKSNEQPRRASMHEQLDNFDEPNEQEFGRAPCTLTSLVSFDPKSRTLLRVREHRESDDDEAAGGYSRIEKVGKVPKHFLKVYI
ncbi:unnamed protein product [Nippostrongylus brasiliensis]|uniref:Uncharacterized protein n=1 Tax=Nippostrongylus brasiliensis TaxID=27835 RepID=A0A0N4XI94_NIPBR|nr:unnamed protein product [Nippostrongylus brasiliensis]